MKKIYILAMAALSVASVNAQSVMKVKLNKKNKDQMMVERSGNSNGSTQALAGSINCATFYAAGTTMDLNLTITLTNTDAEYGDSVAITFPAGITPNVSPTNSNPICSDAADPGPDGPEALNGVNGQTISWGNNDNNWGGVVADGVAYAFTVNVTIGAGVTGTQVANYHVSGDGFGGAPADLDGTFNIFPAGAALVDLTTTFVVPLNLTSLQNCNYGSDTVVAQIKNLGTTTESNITVVYSVNGVAQPSTVVAGPLAPGDSAYVFWFPAYDFSATNAYDLKAWVAQASDISAANDTAALSFSNNVSIALTTTSYTNGIETPQEIADLSVTGTAAGFTGLSTGTFHTGAQALFTTVATTQPAGSYEVKVILPCMDVVAGEIYRISYWRRTNAANAGNGQSTVYTGTDMTVPTLLKPYSANTVGVWTKDSADFTATVSETRYFALGGQGTVSATSQMNCRFDDINISKVLPIGINSVSVSNAISIFPNPSAGTLNVKINAKQATLEVYDILGHSVAGTQQIFSGNNSVNLNNLNSGVYFVRINDNGKVSTHRITINKD